MLVYLCLYCGNRFGFPVCERENFWGSMQVFNWPGGCVLLRWRRSQVLLLNTGGWASVARPHGKVSHGGWFFFGFVVLLMWFFVLFCWLRYGGYFKFEFQIPFNSVSKGSLGCWFQIWCQISDPIQSTAWNWPFFTKNQVFFLILTLLCSIWLFHGCIQNQHIEIYNFVSIQFSVTLKKNFDPFPDSQILEPKSFLIFHASTVPPTTNFIETKTTAY